MRSWETDQVRCSAHSLAVVPGMGEVLWEE